MSKINFTAVRQNVKFPDKATIGSVGWDLYNNSGKDIIINPGTREAIHTGIKIMEMPKGYFAQIFDKSSIALKGVSVMGGVIDSDYRGELIVILMNHNREEKIILQNKSKVAQMILLSYLDESSSSSSSSYPISIEYCDEKNCSITNCELQKLNVKKTINREANGFGSSGEF
ncbi:deoxyuridine 5'-triphosphate nucleotidohydrolase-like [Brevipalpus obovatus]|uniref:deoxyuridine 5'-triphosphate nucleotidohydrolase-like n=1 Tax=Brevipalpus obovatus TaxID=246614 RepID=UPI003D9F902B